MLAGVYAIAERHDLIVTNVFHAGDGNLHPLFSFDLSVPGTLERVLAAGDEIVRLCVDAGGSLSAASTASAWRSATSCRSCSPRRTSTRRRACGRRSIPTAG